MAKDNRVAIGSKVRFLGMKNYWVDYEEIVIVDGFLGDGTPYTNASKLEGGEGNGLALAFNTVPLRKYEFIDTWVREKEFAKPGHRVILRNLCPTLDKTCYDLKENMVYKVSKQGDSGNITLENGIEIPPWKYSVLSDYSANMRTKQTSIEINVDVSESIAGLKKLQREIRTTIADIKELESRL